VIFTAPAAAPRRVGTSDAAVEIATLELVATGVPLIVVLVTTGFVVVADFVKDAMLELLVIEDVTELLLASSPLQPQHSQLSVCLSNPISPRSAYPGFTIGSERLPPQLPSL